MFYIILYISFVLIVTVAGGKREIGSGMAFVFSLFLSPIVGLIIVLLSDRIDGLPYLKKQQEKLLSEAALNINKKDFEKALPIVYSAIETNPSTAGKAYYYLGIIYSSIGEIPKSYHALITADDLGYNIEEVEKSDWFINLRNDKHFPFFANNAYKSFGDAIPMDKVNNLVNLAQLYKDGLLTDAEFSTAKKQLI
jgi:hypothetical protein